MTTLNHALLCMVALLVCCAPLRAETENLEALYLANEGVMVAQAGTKIVFDPLYDNTYGTYQAVPEVLRAALLSATPPFDNIEALFVSHSHGDHFSAADVATFMAAHPRAWVVAPSQAIAQLKKIEPLLPAQRMISIALEYDAKPLTLTVGSLQVEAVRIAHAGGAKRRAIENILYRVKMPNDAIVMHLGDADPAATHYEPYAEHWRSRSTDLAFPPYWFLNSAQGRALLTSQLNAGQSIGVHVPVEIPPELKASGADFFTQPGESRTIRASIAP